jgi:hypothetical protein
MPRQKPCLESLPIKIRRLQLIIIRIPQGMSLNKKSFRRNLTEPIPLIGQASQPLNRNNGNIVVDTHEEFVGSFEK